MKLKLLLCTFFAIICAKSYSQTPAGKQVVPGTQLQLQQTKKDLPIVSKSEFLAVTRQLDNLLIEHKTEEAKAKWTEVSKMLNQSFSLSEERGHGLQKSGDKVAVAKYADKMNDQTRIHARITVLANNMENNRSELNDALKEFAENLD